MQTVLIGSSLAARRPAWSSAVCPQTSLGTGYDYIVDGNPRSTHPRDLDIPHPLSHSHKIDLRLQARHPAFTCSTIISVYPKSHSMLHGACQVLRSDLRPRPLLSPILAWGFAHQDKFG